MNKIISGVYQITNNVNGKFYIGCSTNILKRWKSHINRSNEKLGREYNKPLYIDFRKTVIAKSIQSYLPLGRVLIKN